MSQAKLFVLMRQKQHISCLPIHAQDNSRGFRRELQIGSEDVSFVPKRILAIDTSCVIIQVDILGLYARKEICDVIFGFVP